MNIHEINDVLKDVGITGELLDLINIKLKKHPKSQHIPVGIYESCFLDDTQDDMPILHKHCEVIGAQYSEDDEDDQEPGYDSDDVNLECLSDDQVKRINFLFDKHCNYEDVEWDEY